MTAATEATPRLPEVGEIYRVERELFDYGPSDPKPNRPAVVVKAPRNWTDRVTVVTRTSDESEVGIAHPADAAIGCTKPGVFSKRHWGSTEAARFVAPQAKFMGTLPEPYLSDVVDMWETS